MMKKALKKYSYKFQYPKTAKIRRGKYSKAILKY